MRSSAAGCLGGMASALTFPPIQVGRRWALAGGGLRVQAGFQGHAGLGAHGSRRWTMRVNCDGAVRQGLCWAGLFPAKASKRLGKRSCARTAGSVRAPG